MSVFINPAFVSFVEHEYFSQMDLLLTVGFGYQMNVIERFLRQRNHNNDHIHKICNKMIIGYAIIIYKQIC